MLHRSLPAAALALCLATAAVANERRYDVEIVILENTDTRAGEAERWKPEVTIPDIEDAIALEGPVELAPMARADLLAEVPEGFESLPPERRKLGGAIDKLRESGRYRVLRHLAWQQPTLDDEEAPAIRVHGGDSMTVRVPIRDFEELDALEDAAAANATGDESDGESSRETGNGDDGVIRAFGADDSLDSRIQPLLRPVEIHPLDGTIRLVVSRYLHIHTDLYFTVPVEWADLESAAEAVPTAANGEEADESGDAVADTDGPETTPLETVRIARGPDGKAMLSYPFVQSRRMRSGEMHYLDHPVLGLLIRVDRAEEDESGEGTSDAGDGEPEDQ